MNNLHIGGLEVAAIHECCGCYNMEEGKRMGIEENIAVSRPFSSRNFAFVRLQACSGVLSYLSLVPTWEYHAA